jgi:hypothetical protein
MIMKLEVRFNLSLKLLDFRVNFLDLDLKIAYKVLFIDNFDLD